MANALVIAIFLLNLVDAGNTYYILTQGLGTELNPVMAWAFGISPEFFLCFKMFIVTLGLNIVYVLQHRVNPVTLKVGLWIVAGFYTLVVSYQLVMLYLLTLTE